jgi:hypothetical protein
MLDMGAGVPLTLALTLTLTLVRPTQPTSSMKMTQGWCSRAYPNISRMMRALSPMYLSTMALDTTCSQSARQVSWKQPG